MNKNQKSIRQQLDKSKDFTITVSIPTHGYHNNAKGVFTTRSLSKGKISRKSEKAKVAAKEQKGESRGPSLAEQRTIFHGY